MENFDEFLNTTVTAWAMNDGAGVIRQQSILSFTGVIQLVPKDFF